MTILSVRQAIQDKNLTFTSVAYTYAGVAGTTKIQTAPDEQPNSLAAADLPCALVFAGPGVWDYMTFGPQGEEVHRDYEIRYYVAAVGQGVAGENYAKAEALLETIGESFNADRDIDESIWHAWTMRDSGVRGDMTFAEQPYVGFTITLNSQSWE